jgi:hypothetical protein
LHVPGLIKFEIVREFDDVGMRGTLPEQYLDRIAWDEMKEEERHRRDGEQDCYEAEEPLR